MAIFISDDKWILQPGGKLDPTDEEILKQAGADGDLKIVTSKQAMAIITNDTSKPFRSQSDHTGEVEMTPEKFVESSKKAFELARELEHAFEIFLSEDIARLIRHLRVEEHFTWRSIARRAYGTASWCNWSPPSNQIAGIKLCSAAAKLLGEDHLSPPWN